MSLANAILFGAALVGVLVAMLPDDDDYVWRFTLVVLSGVCLAAGLAGIR